MSVVPSRRKSTNYGRIIPQRKRNGDTTEKYGVVKKWIPSRGFGFIIADDENDEEEIFCHMTQIFPRTRLKQGERVTFIDGIDTRNGKRRAMSVVSLEPATKKNFVPGSAEAHRQTAKLKRENATLRRAMWYVARNPNGPANRDRPNRAAVGCSSHRRRPWGRASPDHRECQWNRPDDEVLNDALRIIERHRKAETAAAADGRGGGVTGSSRYGLSASATSSGPSRAPAAAEEELEAGYESPRSEPAAARNAPEPRKRVDWDCGYCGAKNANGQESKPLCYNCDSPKSGFLPSWLCRL